MMDIFIFHFDFIPQVLPILLAFLPVTIFIMLLSAAVGLLLGGLLAWAKLSRRRFPRAAAQGYTTLMRCTPTIVLMFVVYYGLPLVLSQLFGWNIHNYSSMLFAVVSLSMLFAATSSELLRSAYEAVDKGQREAAVAVGLSEWQAFRRVVAPQCVRIIMPNLALSMVRLTKEASLAFTIGVVDLVGKARLVISNHYNAYSVETYLTVALIYWLLAFSLQLLVVCTERRKYGRQLGYRTGRNMPSVMFPDGALQAQGGAGVTGYRKKGADGDV